MSERLGNEGLHKLIKKAADEGIEPYVERLLKAINGPWLQFYNLQRRALADAKTNALAPSRRLSSRMTYLAKGNGEKDFRELAAVSIARSVAHGSLRKKIYPTTKKSVPHRYQISLVKTPKKFEEISKQ